MAVSPSTSASSSRSMSPELAVAPAIEALWDLTAIRAQACKIKDAAEAGATPWIYDASKIEAVAQKVVAVIDEAYPKRDIPRHARWGHFIDAEGIDRAAKLPWPTDAHACARARIDLAVVSVLLDAGAGPDWTYLDAQGQRWSRSEGLAMASLAMFAEGLFSSDAEAPLQVDAQGLRALKLETLAKAFQVGPNNPLVGLEGRWGLLTSLADAMAAKPKLFGVPAGSKGDANGLRPGGLVDCLLRENKDSLDVTCLLRAIQLGLGPIWPSRLSLDGVGLGDVWQLVLPGQSEPVWAPLHKLSQWLTYSLIDPFVALGCTIVGEERLTPLAEYRNGGLLVDMGMLRLRDPSLAGQPHPPSSPLIVAWRTLTICGIDAVAEAVRKLLGAPSMSLGSILEGGTWRAGRVVAQEKRSDGSPPIRLLSDGTVF